MANELEYSFIVFRDDGQLIMLHMMYILSENMT
jgi:hypothetical protein